MEDYTIYSEEEYYDRIQLLSMYSPTVCNCIWEEINKYREPFRYDIHFSNKRTFITLNRTLFQKMIRIYDLPLQKEIVNQKFTHYCSDNESGIKDLLLKYIYVNRMVMPQEMFQFLISDEFLLLRIYVIYEFISDWDFLYIYLHVNKKLEWYAVISQMKLVFEKNSGNYDLTKHFRDFLDTFYFHSSHNMIQLSGTVYEQMDMEELLSLYPTCSEKQMSFYLKSAQKNHYYTISQYMKMNKVSYETARKAMEHLVELNFYQKIKVGKKFVFTPVD